MVLMMYYWFRLVLGMAVVMFFGHFRDNNVFFNGPVEVGRNVRVRILMLQMWRMVMLNEGVVVIMQLWPLKQLFRR